ncbi:hypothetical protein HYS31_03435 [Candidatus Woesearchaeota archaeon]|nr:hypothetical protein [Candidatus Woesearchaeota archaeon]
MAKLTRTKEIWHIPKRGSVHQTIYMVYVLTWDRFLGKSWSSGKQESLGSEMGKAGLTEDGRAITHQSIRTLLANIPKYLGFVYIDESSKPSRIMVTDIGYDLIRKHNIEKVKHYKNLAEYKANKDLIEISEVFAKQMLKLIITNPTIRKDCQNVLVFPFRMTLRLLLELDYLDKEEIGYILFHTKKEDETNLVIEKIKNFRNLSSDRRLAEISAYEKTEEGQLTLVKAPTAGYYMYLCYSTGLCERVSMEINKPNNQKLPAIKLKNKDEAKKILASFKNIEIYDFKDDWFLWKEYFSNPNRMHPPHDVIIGTNSKKDVIVTVYKDKNLLYSDGISNKNPQIILPVFRNEEYDFIVYDTNEGKEILKQKVEFDKDKTKFLLNIKNNKEKIVVNEEILTNQIKEMFSNSYEGFDKQYYHKLKVIEKILAKNFIDNRRKGGRLEYLFFELLNILKNKDVIDEVFWYGKLEKYGICEPAPGGKDGNPDIVFEIGNYLFVLELTTYRGIRAQWSSAEASSVPDHISKAKKENNTKQVIGIFSAPDIHHQLQKNLMLNARQENVGMIFLPCVEFAEILSTINKSDLLKYLLNKKDTQLDTTK